jgi:competence protein ComEC
MRQAGVPIQLVGAGDFLRLGEVSAEVVWPVPRVDAGAGYRNNDGLVLLMRYGDRRFLFAADVEAAAEAALRKLHADLSSDVVKVAHHGSKTSSTDGLVTAAQAQLAIISVGRHSMFGHPNRDVVERWRASGARVMTTGAKGTITVESDGRALSVRTYLN